MKTLTPVIIKPTTLDGIVLGTVMKQNNKWIFIQNVDHLEPQDLAIINEAFNKASMIDKVLSSNIVIVL